MGIQKKFVLLLVSVFTIYTLTAMFLLREVVGHAFETLENDLAKKNFVRAQEAIESDLAVLLALSADWASWDDTKDFVNGGRPDFVDVNLSMSTMAALDVNLLMFIDPAGNLVWGRLLDLGHEQWGDLDGLFLPPLSPDSQLIHHESPESKVNGIIQTRDGLMMISSVPILTSADKGPVAGAVILGRNLDTARIAQIRRQAAIDFDFYPGPARGFPAEVVTSVRNSEPMPIKRDDALYNFQSYTDIYGESVGVLVVRTARDVMALAGRTILITSLLFITAGVLVTAIIWVLLSQAILRPLLSLTDHLLAIRKTGDLSQRISTTRGDELGFLTREFDAMMTQLATARRQLVDHSFKAGMAETASDMLHNIRNSMMPLINRISGAQAELNRAGKLHLTEAVEEMGAVGTSMRRREKLARYTELVARELEVLHGNAHDELCRAARQAEHVEEILAKRESIAHEDDNSEVIELEQVVGEALEVIGKRDETDIPIDIVNTVGEHKVQVHRLRLLQVLNNILVNSWESIQRTSQTIGEIGITADLATVDNENMVRLSIRDNGIGIDQDLLTRVFQRGYSTKSDHGGLGLHWCANTVNAMGGRVRLESAGPGQGAEFQLLLPTG